MPGLVTHPSYDIPLQNGHQFPATKFSRLMAILARVMACWRAFNITRAGLTPILRSFTVQTISTRLRGNAVGRGAACSGPLRKCYATGPF